MSTAHFIFFLPLHLIVRFKKFNLISSLSLKADCLRYFINKYLEAAEVKDGQEKNPYDYAISNNLSPYIQRLFLQADLTFNPSTLHRLNNEQRRMAMFPAFRAVVATLHPTIFSRLRGENKILLECYFILVVNLFDE